MPEKTKLKWLVSYETLKFDTSDGDLGKNQFARWKGQTYVRQHPKNNHQFIIFGISNTNETETETLDTTGMEEVQVIDERGAYYDEFRLPDGRTLRVPSTKKKYWDTAKIANHPQPSKEVSTEEINEITKDDGLWQ